MDSPRVKPFGGPERSILHVEKARNIRGHGVNSGWQLPPVFMTLTPLCSWGRDTSLTPSHPEADHCNEASYYLCAERPLVTGKQG